jgi:hypothetical protein
MPRENPQPDELIPSPSIVAEKLAQALHEAKYYKRLLKLSEDAAKNIEIRSRVRELYSKKKGPGS